MKIKIEDLRHIEGIGNKTMQRVYEYINERMDYSYNSFPSKKYNIIYADPPWAYNESGSGENRVVHAHYDTMQADEIYRLPVRKIAEENCILFLWVTFPRLNEGINTIFRWGFNYYGLGFNWVKLNKKSRSLFWGMGYYTRQNPEICLIGTKGEKFKPKVRNIHSVVMAKVEGHSKKPDVVRDNIVKIIGDLPRIELFARQESEGWDVWGNEIKGGLVTDE